MTAQDFIDKVGEHGTHSVIQTDGKEKRIAIYIYTKRTDTKRLKVASIMALGDAICAAHKASCIMSDEEIDKYLQQSALRDSST